MAKRKLIIDCDAGIDDAQAILLALSQDVEVLAITCVAGNTPIDKVCVNVLKVLEVCDRTDIPVYKGATGPLLGKMLKNRTYLKMWKYRKPVRITTYLPASRPFPSLPEPNGAKRKINSNSKVLLN